MDKFVLGLDAFLADFGQCKITLPSGLECLSWPVQIRGTTTHQISALVRAGIAEVRSSNPAR